jgi:DNA-binding transcriptional LysR family regulator
MGRQGLPPVDDDGPDGGPDISQLRLDEQVELRHLRYFLAVADAGSMTEGARRLQLAQSPLSQQIRQLEARLGATLFERARGRAAQLTEAGHVLYLRAQQIMAVLDEASEEVRGVASGASGRLRFGAVPTIAPHLTRPLQSFAERFPQVMVLFREAGAERLASEIQSGDIDMGFARLPIPPTDVDVRVLWGRSSCSPCRPTTPWPTPASCP